MTLQTLTIVGVGLIGGSVGLAARNRRLAHRVIGVGRSRASLEQATQLGAIDDSTCDLAEAARQSDLVLICTPVDQIADQVRSAAAACRPGAVLSDTGSTKEVIVTSLDQSTPPHVAFVGGHPVAGSEQRGPDHARADLFEGRVVVLTPTLHTDPVAVEFVTAFWKLLGARVVQLSPRSHDEALAITSHLPHLLAAALSSTLSEELFDLAATGFRDTTRLACESPDLWTAIFAQNRSAVLAALTRLTDRLTACRAALEDNDMSALRHMLTEAKRIREALG